MALRHRHTNPKGTDRGGTQILLLKELSTEHKTGQNIDCELLKRKKKPHLYAYCKKEGKKKIHDCERILVVHSIFFYWSCFRKFPNLTFLSMSFTTLIFTIMVIGPTRRLQTLTCCLGAHCAFHLSYACGHYKKKKSVSRKLME